MRAELRRYELSEFTENNFQFVRIFIETSLRQSGNVPRTITKQLLLKYIAHKEQEEEAEGMEGAVVRHPKKFKKSSLTRDELITRAQELFNKTETLPLAE